MYCVYLCVVPASESTSEPSFNSVGRSSFVIVFLRPVFPSVSLRKILLFVDEMTFPSPDIDSCVVVPDTVTSVVT